MYSHNVCLHKSIKVASFCHCMNATVHPGLMTLSCSDLNTAGLFLKSSSTACFTFPEPRPCITNMTAPWGRVSSCIRRASMASRTVNPLKSTVLREVWIRASHVMPRGGPIDDGAEVSREERREACVAPNIGLLLLFIYFSYYL